MWKSPQKPFLSAEELGTWNSSYVSNTVWNLRQQNRFSRAMDWHQDHSKICVNFCDHKLTHTDFTISFYVFTFLISCCMGFISAILEMGFNVLCSYRCSSRFVVLLEIYWSFCQQKRLDSWFMMKAAFSPGWRNTACPPFSLAFKECLEISPDQWWAGTGTEEHLQWRDSVPQQWWGWCAGRAAGQERLPLWSRHEQMKNRPHVSSFEVWYLGFCVPLFVCFRHLNPCHAGLSGFSQLLKNFANTHLLMKIKQ